MKYRFHIVDVFSRSAFGGNQLAVLPDARGISTAGMQHVAREFNFAETTFVLPAKQAGNTCQVRIFTPKAEIAFAGHPTVGTACALVMAGHGGTSGDRTLILEEGVGPVVVNVYVCDGLFNGVLTLPGKVEQPTVAPGANNLADVLSLAAVEVTQVFFASVGVPFCFVHVTSRDAVDRAVIDRTAWSKHLSSAWAPNVLFFAGDLTHNGELYARMWAPALGVEEDPATGSACAALVGALASRPDFMGEVCESPFSKASRWVGAVISKPSLEKSMGW